MPICIHPDANTARLFTARDYVTGDAFEIWLCDACGLARTVPQPDAAQSAAYYPTAYYGTPSARRFPSIVEALQRRLYARRARAVERLAGGPGRVLDVGCGRGFLLDAFRRRGWDVHGTELDERSSAHAREVLGIDVRIGPDAASSWPDGHFDAVTMWHVIEHLPDPARALAMARRLLRPGGVLLVGAPNFGSPEARLTREGWFHLDVPRHLTHPTPAWLRGALEDAGLSFREASFFAPEYDTFSLVQSAENWMGLRHNALYDVLRRRSAKVLGSGGAGALQSAAAVVLAVPLGIAALAATSALGAAGRGSSMTMLAVRRP
jgi:SAM-dependent methyltransferase